MFLYSKNSNNLKWVIYILVLWKINQIYIFETYKSKPEENDTY